MVAASKKPLYSMVQDLLEAVGPVFYERSDLRLNHPVAKDELVKLLVNGAPAEIGGEKVNEVSPRDGVKYILSDDSWLLIRPSGTEPVLRIYAEGRNQEMMKAMLEYGQQIAASIV